MENLLVLVFTTLILSCLISDIHSNPEEYQRCGEKLANMMALVCKGRGYNTFFPRNERMWIRRDKRAIGIVDECCRNPCSISTLQDYCGPLTTESPENTQIRKRSDSDKDWAQEMRPEDKEVLTFRPQLLDNIEEFRSHLHGNGLMPKRTEILNSITKQSALVSIDNTEQKDIKNEQQNSKFSNKILGYGLPNKSHEDKRRMSSKEDTRIFSSREDKRMTSSREDRRITNSKENRRVANSKEKLASRCNAVSGCRTHSGRSKEVSGIDRRDLVRNTIQETYKSEKTRNTERSSHEQNRIRHSHHDKNRKNSSRERRPSAEDQPRTSQVGTLSPYYLRKGLVLNPKTSRLNLRQDQ